MSKAGLDHLTRYLACEWGPAGVRVNSVDPWFIKTDLTEPLLSDKDFRAAVDARTPLRRPGEPHEVAGVVAFLCARPEMETGRAESKGSGAGRPRPSAPEPL